MGHALMGTFGRAPQRVVQLSESAMPVGPGPERYRRDVLCHRLVRTLHRAERLREAEMLDRASALHGDRLLPEIDGTAVITLSHADLGVQPEARCGSRAALVLY